MEWTNYLRFLLALLVVLGLIGGFAWIARRTGVGGIQTGKRGRSDRLEVVEALSIDARRRLVIVRRDDREHLLLLGPDGERVIETNITPMGGNKMGGTRS
ncbi:MAG: FliO/MopB family protein [Rhodospirillaceae bacterium]|jgi:flagellar protein FliO/FliZ|nr:FliO/MopB family protein [Rhodospirillaceae bacterium]MBT4487377.1 FliO/MopB family protein [Rhodospirillaceae bacterium]MBT4687637.1 FliO/MopB family protein [Rhodospirillaceae bacterium]MBT5191070.1 FliO/MopB family protein [Rhodospirillaceae bacterium]MBT5899008.1 FliO/MopB family protein [Rhodospirillaceae bacterium]